jgi:hypothetical protein
MFSYSGVVIEIAFFIKTKACGIRKVQRRGKEEIELKGLFGHATYSMKDPLKLLYTRILAS